MGLGLELAGPQMRRDVLRLRFKASHDGGAVLLRSAAAASISIGTLLNTEVQEAVRGDELAS